MLREVYKVDDNGFIIDNYVGEFDEEGNLISPEGEFVTKPLPQPLYFYRPRWNGEDWVEGESEELRSEREAKALLDALKPSEDELQNAQFEIKVLTLLTDLEVI